MLIQGPIKFQIPHSLYEQSIVISKYKEKSQNHPQKIPFEKSPSNYRTPTVYLS
jgi:hypothetical protein